MGSRLMDALDQFVLGPMNLICRVEGLLQMAKRREGAVKFALKRTDKGGDTSRADAKRVLSKYKVKTFGEGFDATYLYFMVGNRQASWAADLLDYAGIEFTTSPNLKRNKKTAGAMPKAWRDRKNPRG